MQFTLLIDRICTYFWTNLPLAVRFIKMGAVCSARRRRKAPHSVLHRYILIAHGCLQLLDTSIVCDFCWTLAIPEAYKHTNNNEYALSVWRNATTNSCCVVIDKYKTKCCWQFSLAKKYKRKRMWRAAKLVSCFFFF